MHFLKFINKKIVNNLIYIDAKHDPQARKQLLIKTLLLTGNLNYFWSKNLYQPYFVPIARLKEFPMMMNR